VKVRISISKEEVGLLRGISAMLGWSILGAWFIYWLKLPWYLHLIVTLAWSFFIGLAGGWIWPAKKLEP